MKLGVLGGTFDPVHLGHLAIAREARYRLALDFVLFIPAGQPWMKSDQKITPAAHRVEMLWLALAGEPAFGISTLEVEREGPTYTVDTLLELKDRFGEGTEIYFIVGYDSIDELIQWREPDKIVELCHVVVVSRPGFPAPNVNELGAKIPALPGRLIVLDGPREDVSSTDIRRRVAQGQSITGLVPEEVEKYIKEHNLYT
jgi:nicotinate-nucleotide adenylyltransferase